MTKGLIDSQTSRFLHLGWLGAVGLIVFVIHTAWSISIAFKRWEIWNFFTKIILLAFYVLLISFFIYVHFFYQSSTEVERSHGLESFNTQTTTTKADEKVFTLENLAQYSGLNGNLAYIAVDGVVYDESSLFVNGKHKGWSAGQDLSSDFHNQHSSDYLNGFVVGILQK
jgi:predicted heme/steroid binding protein